MTVYNLESYIPDALIPQYEALRDSLVSLLETLGIIRGTDSATSGTLQSWDLTANNA